MSRRLNPPLPEDATAAVRALRAAGGQRSPARARYRAYLHALHALGWSSSALARAAEVTHGAMWQTLHSDGPDTEVDLLGLPLPALPSSPPLPSNGRNASTSARRADLTDAEVEELRVLAPVKARCRATHGPGDAPYDARETYTRVVVAAYERGVTAYAMSQRTGENVRTINVALWRGGARDLPPSARDRYTRTTPEENR